VARLTLARRIVGSSTQIKSPFTCDYGTHIRIGRNGFANYGCEPWERETDAEVIHESAGVDLGHQCIAGHCA
jgi:acetyltransferase-like isoleucine patch superfamily enzyme